MKTRSALLAAVPALLAACANDRPAADPSSAAAAASASAPSPGAADGKLQSVIADPRRPAAERSRDAFRHPAETLAFFGLREDSHVVELWPGGGWYTAILAPVVKDKGKLTITSFDPSGPPDAYSTKSAKRLRERLDGAPDLFGKVEVRVVHPPADLNLGPDSSADLVLTFRNFHNWMTDGSESNVLAAAYKVLKPGGIFAVEEHRAKPGISPEESKKTGYVDEAYLVSQAERAGFKLVAKSELNANAKDTKDHPEGVWTLPPTLALKDKDRAKYEAIGESDRMTLKFQKPAP